MKISSNQKMKRAVLTGVLIKTDGTRVDLGVMARYESNPFKRIFHSIKDALKGRP